LKTERSRVEALKAAKLARDHDYGTAAGLLFVHAGIAYGDAVSIHLAGVRSTSDNHYDATVLLTEAAARVKERDRGVAHLRRLIDEKSRVASTGEILRKPEVEVLENHAERFRAWCEGILGAA
jgi:hypothetical protein